MRLSGAVLMAAALLAAPALAQEQQIDTIDEALRQAVVPTAPPEPSAAAPSATPPDAAVPAPAATPPTTAATPPAPAAVEPAPQQASPTTPFSTDEPEEAESALPAAPVPYTPQIVAPRAPAPYRPSASQSYTYDGYDDRLRSSFASAQGLLGTLDGGWVLSDASGRRLFAFQLVDKGSSDGMVEGVWRDLRRTPTPTSSGLIGTIHRVGGQLTMSFAASRGGFTTVTLDRSIDGSWGGRISEPSGESAVSMRRGS